MFLSRQKKLHLIFIEFYATKNVCLQFFLEGGGELNQLCLLWSNIEKKLREKEKNIKLIGAFNYFAKCMLYFPYKLNREIFTLLCFMVNIINSQLL